MVELLLSELSKAFGTACRHIFSTLCFQSLKMCFSHGLSVVGVSYSVVLKLSGAAIIRSYPLESSNTLSVFLFHLCNSKVWLRSVDEPDFPNIVSKFSGCWSSVNNILFFDLCKLVLRLMP